MTYCRKLLVARQARKPRLQLPQPTLHVGDSQFKHRHHPKIVQFLQGHAFITQTMDAYSHLVEGIGGDTVDGLNEAFG